MERQILHVDIKTIRECSRTLAERLRNANIDVIVPILKGGVVLASMLGRDLGVDKFSCIHIKTTASDTRNAEFLEPVCLGVTNESELAGKNILIVDDICDTGRSLEFAKEYLKRYNPQKISECVAINVNSKRADNIMCALDYSVENYWIVFPWED